MRCGLLVTLAFGLVTSLAAQAPVVPAVVMEDQFDRAQDVAALRGQVVVLIYGDRKSADANKTLGEQLHVHFHPAAKGLPPGQARQQPVKPIEGVPRAKPVEVQAVAIACIGKVPPLVKRVIRGQVKNGSPEVAVWLDFEDVMKTRFPFTAGVPNVAVLDTQGRYRYATSGVPTADTFATLTGVLEALRKEAAAGK